MSDIKFEVMDIFDSGADLLAIPTNTQGVMGAGLAKVAKNRYPAFYAKYRSAYESDSLRIGRLLYWSQAETRMVAINMIEPVTRLVALHTKEEWAYSTKGDYILQGLKALHEFVLTMGFDSVALPMLGCGLGGYDEERLIHLIRGNLNPERYEITVCELSPSDYFMTLVQD